MKQLFKKSAALFLAVGLCLSVSVVPAFAGVFSSKYLDAYRAWCTPESKGNIAVTVDVQANYDMDEIGANRIQIYESKDGGETWQSVKVYLKSMFPELVTSNDYIYYDTPVVFSGTVGYKYFAKVTVYAGDSTGGDSRDYSTPIVTAIR